MAVFLSPVGGVAAQFFTNTGAVLTGGKLYTYLAGTTTPAVTYTTSAGTTARTNPVVLDSAGRVPGIGTYDNISGAGSLTVQNYTGNGSTVGYAVSGNVVNVYINGVYQNRNTYSFANGTLTFSEAPPLTSLIEILYN